MRKRPRAHALLCLLQLLLGLRCPAVLLNLPQPQVDDVPCSPEELQDKQYDVTIVGARVADTVHFVKYLAGLPKQPCWAFASPMADALERNTLILELGPKAADIGISTIGIDMRDIEGLTALARKSKVVLNLMGPPYEQLCAENLINAALKGCSHYVDMSTETGWKVRMLHAYGPLATIRQLTIVQSAGFDSMASDFLAAAAAQDLVKAGYHPPTDVMVVWDVVNGAADVADVARPAAGGYAMQMQSVVTDPYALAPSVPRDLRVDKFVDGTYKFTEFDEFLVTAVRRCKAAGVDAPVIRRSMHMLYPNGSVAVKEVCTTSMVTALSEFRKAHGAEPTPEVRSAGGFKGRGKAFYHSTHEILNNIPYTSVEMRGVGDPRGDLSPKLAWHLSWLLAERGPKQLGYSTPVLAVGTEALEERFKELDDGMLIRITHGDD